MKSIAISIVTYKTDESHLKRCLASIRQSTVQAVVTVVDNSPFEAALGIALDFGCGYIHLPENCGYGKGHNVALTNSLENGHSYHVVLNPDVAFGPDVLETLVDYMDQNPHVAHVMPRILNPDGSLQRVCKLLPTPVDLLVRRFLPASWAKEQKQKFELWSSGYNKVMFVPYLSGCFMFLRCSALKEVGFFDERFFMYPEDIDLTRRLAEKFETHFYPHVSVMHEHGAGSYSSWGMLWIHVANIVRYFNKWGWFVDPVRNRLNRKTLESLPKNSIRSG